LRLRGHADRLASEGSIHHLLFLGGEDHYLLLVINGAIVDGVCESILLRFIVHLCIHFHVLTVMLTDHGWLKVVVAEWLLIHIVKLFILRFISLYGFNFRKVVVLAL